MELVKWYPHPKLLNSFAASYRLLITSTHFIVVERLASVWRANEKKVWTLAISEDCREFREYYDDIQEKISQISVLDELLAGMCTYIALCM